MKKKFIDEKGESFIYNDAYFNSNTFINIKGSNQKEHYKNSVEKILEKLSNYIENGSNYVFDEIVSFDINVVKYKPFKGEGYFPLPDFIKK